MSTLKVSPRLTDDDEGLNCRSTPVACAWAGLPENADQSETLSRLARTITTTPAAALTARVKGFDAELLSSLMDAPSSYGISTGPDSKKLPARSEKSVMSMKRLPS